jgi:hypothetical protein
MVSSESAISSGSVRTFEFKPMYEGDHAYRNCVLKWAVPQGMWGILRVQPSALVTKTLEEPQTVMGSREADDDTVPEKNHAQDDNLRHREAATEHEEATAEHVTAEHEITEYAVTTQGDLS